MFFDRTIFGTARFLLFSLDRRKLFFVSSSRSLRFVLFFKFCHPFAPFCVICSFALRGSFSVTAFQIFTTVFYSSFIFTRSPRVYTLFILITLQKNTLDL